MRPRVGSAGGSDGAGSRVLMTDTVEGMSVLADAESNLTSDYKGDIDLPDGYSPSEDEAFMNPLQLSYFRKKLLIWKDDIHREAKETLATLQKEPLQEADARRPRLERDRLVDRASHPRPPAQADRQDRFGDPPHLRRRIWLLRSHRRADLAGPARSPADRDDDPRGAGAPRARRENHKGRVGRRASLDFARDDIFLST